VSEHLSPLSIEALADAKHAADMLIDSGICNVREVRQLRDIIDRIDASVRQIREQEEEPAE
jgi:hypothetical protein